MNQIIIYEDEFHSGHTFKEYCSTGLGEHHKNAVDEWLTIEWKTEAEITKEIALKLEQMDSEQVFCWIQDTLRSK